MQAEHQTVLQQLQRQGYNLLLFTALTDVPRPSPRAGEFLVPEAKEAMAYLETGRAKGKVVLAIS